MNKLFIVFVIVLSSFILHAQKSPKNVILIIGDNKSIELIFSQLKNNSTTDQSLQRFSKTLHKPSAFNNKTTDSGAAATALACGINTKNGMVGMDADTNAVKSIITIAKDNSLSTGIVTTCDVTHATPASFLAHQPSRKMSDAIAMDIFNSDINVLIGGGKSNFDNREDNRDLLNEFKKKKYLVATKLSEIKNKKHEKLIALLAENHLPTMPQRGNMLTESSTDAINLLKENKKGFFLLIESSHIDWLLYKSDSQQITSELNDLKKCIHQVLEFASHNKNTLVILTSDQLKAEETQGTANENDTSKVTNKTTVSRIDQPIGLYAFGPGSETFKGTIKTTSIKGKLISLLKLKVRN